MKRFWDFLIFVLWVWVFWMCATATYSVINGIFDYSGTMFHWFIGFVFGGIALGMLRDAMRQLRKVLE